MTSNKGQAKAFLSELILCMHARGFHSASRPPEPKNVPPTEKVRHGNIIGLPVTTAVRSSASLDLSGSVREAQEEATAEGHDVYVAITPRRGKPIEASYVVTTLEVWLTVLARLHPEAVTATA